MPNRFLSCSWLNQNGPYLWVCSCSQRTLFSSQGYTIPLDKRLASDGRGLQDHTINDNFAKLAQALYTADREVSGHFLCSVAFFPSSASCSPCVCYYLMFIAFPSYLVILSSPRCTRLEWHPSIMPPCLTL